MAGVTLSGLDLRECTFAAVDGLDGLVITGTDVLASNRDHTRRGSARGRRWWRADRRVIRDELDPRTPAPTGQPEPAEPLSLRDVSATYRALRKALEDNKDEPGAADFYYGEMEMRRLAAPSWSVERWLLTAYWLVSGYGLRAWRALATLLVVIAVAGWCFTNSAWVRPSPAGTTPVLDPDSRVWPWAFAAQETVALFRPAGTIGVTLVGAGVAVDLAVRILGPALLALAVLAIRNRTKR